MRALKISNTIENMIVIVEMIRIVWRLGSIAIVPRMGCLIRR